MNVTLRGKRQHHRTVSFDALSNSVVLIEQRLLPHEFRLVKTRNYRETAEAITTMVVRGAGAIGATAAYGLAQGARAFRGSRLDRFETHIGAVYQTLKDARPTAVDPVNAMNAIREEMAMGETVSERQDIAFAAASRFAEEDVEHCRTLGEHGASLIETACGSSPIAMLAGWHSWTSVRPRPRFMRPRPLAGNSMSTAMKPVRVARAHR